MKIGLPGKSILRYYFQENRTSRRPFLLLRISFLGRSIFIQLVPGCLSHILPSVALTPTGVDGGGASIRSAPPEYFKFSLAELASSHQGHMLVEMLGGILMRCVHQR